MAVVGRCRANRHNNVLQPAYWIGENGAANNDLGLLLDGGAVARRRPDALRCRLLADGDAFVEAFVSPDVHPLVEPADVGSEDAGKRRELDASGQVFAPTLGHDGDAAGLQHIGAHLEIGARGGGVERRRIGQGLEDLRLHLGDELRGLGWPDAALDGIGTDLGALQRILVGPDVDDLIERANLGVPEGGEGRELQARLERIGPALQKFGQRARVQGVGAELVDHGIEPSLVMRNQGTFAPLAATDNLPHEGSQQVYECRRRVPYAERDRRACAGRPKIGGITLSPMRFERSHANQPSRCALRLERDQINEDGRTRR